MIKIFNAVFEIVFSLFYDALNGVFHSVLAITGSSKKVELTADFINVTQLLKNMI